MITEFKVGCRYKWVGPSYFRSNWIEQMEVWKDGKVRKCIGIHPVRAAAVEWSRISFENIDGEWDYRHVLEYFIQVDKQLELEFNYDK